MTVNHYYILSAAHCFHETIYKSAKNIKARVGEHDTKTSAESKYTLEYQVENINIHEQYNPNKNHNDLALLKVNSPIEWSMGVGPACMPYAFKSTHFDNAYSTIVGWGTTHFAGPQSTVLLKASVVIDSWSECQKYYPNLKANQICTKPPAHSKSDSCQLDSGGPVYFSTTRQYLLGVISFGTYCNSGKPSVNSRVTSYLSWIESNTGGGFCKK